MTEGKSFTQYKREQAAMLGREGELYTQLEREELHRKAKEEGERRRAELERIKNRVRLEKSEKALTVGQLRKWLAQYPDDLPVWYSGPNWQEETATVPLQYGDVVRRDGYSNPSYYEYQGIPEHVEISVY